MPITNAQNVKVRRNPIQQLESIQLANRAVSTQCTSCPSLEPCPICPKGQSCQLAIPPSCAQCPKYNCVPDPNSAGHSSSAGPIGGAIGGILLAFVLAGFLFWFWRRRHQAAKAAVRKARVDAKIRAAGEEKFRPGASRSNLIGGINDDGEKSRHSSQRGDGTESPLTNSKLGRKTPNSSGGVAEEGQELDDEDTEWTELREDGLTAFRAKPGQKDDLNQDLNALKRRSIGAATHLSRITEGAEEEEDEDNRRTSRIYDTIIEETTIGLNDDDNLRADGHVRAHSSGTSIGTEMNKARSRKSQNGRISNPFLDGLDVSSIMSGTSSQNAFPEVSTGSSNLEHTNWSSLTALEAPSRVHRPVGAPLVDLQGKPRAMSPTASTSPSMATSPMSALLTPSPHASSMMSGGAPSRPMRKPDLNLRLEDGAEPGKIGDDLKKSPRSPGPFWGGEANSDRGLLSPAAPSTPSSMYFDSRRNTSEVRKGLDHQSDSATKRSDKRLSAMTTNSVSTVGTMDYVMGAPQIISTVISEAPKRMQLNTGKAHLVRSLSAIRREQEEQKANGRESATYLDTDYAPSQTEDPFSDIQGTMTPGTRRSLSPANTFGQELGSPRDTPSNMMDGNLYPSFARKTLQASRPQSVMSGASLPFVDRPIREPTDRSPTDANYRESVLTLGSQRGGIQPRASGLSGRPLTNFSRQSSTSIGGLSVFDEIPFHIGQEDMSSHSIGHSSLNDSSQQHVQINMPNDAHSKIHEAKQRILSQASDSHHTVDMDAPETVNGDDLISPFDDQNAAPSINGELEDVRESMDGIEDLRSINTNGGSSHDVTVDENDEDLDGLVQIGTVRKEAPLRTGTNSNFDEIRLRHELDNYPFDIDGATTKS